MSGDFTQAPPPPPPGGYQGQYPPQGPPQGFMPPPPPKPKGLAVASMVCGIIAVPLGFCCGLFGLLVAIPAIVLGAVALGKINKGEAEGKGMAMAGLICGILGAFLGVAMFIIGLMLPNTYYEDLMRDLENY